jgi:hypothetical protein
MYLDIDEKYSAFIITWSALKYELSVDILICYLCFQQDNFLYYIFLYLCTVITYYSKGQFIKAKLS